MTEPLDPSSFELELESVQSLLMAYIRTMVPQQHLAQDILQETNLVLLKKKSQFTTGTSFWHWSKKVAYFQIMAHWKTIKRNRLVFDEDILHQIEDEMNQLYELQDHQKRLQQCLEKLPEKQAEMVRLHYRHDMDLDQISKTTNSKKDAISAILYRARKKLYECIKTSST